MYLMLCRMFLRVPRFRVTFGLCAVQKRKRKGQRSLGWFTPPFDTADDVKHRLEPYYDILDFHVEGAMLYFRAKKR